MAPVLQLAGLALDVAGALLLGIDALGKLGSSSETEAKEEQDRYYGHFAGSKEEMKRDLRERWLPPIKRRRRLRGVGALLLLAGFVLQGIGITFGL